MVHTGTWLNWPWISAFTGNLLTDIKLDNIQNTLPDDETAILKGFVNAERTRPSPRKAIDEICTIYTSRPLEYGGIMTFPILSDLGSCMFGREECDDIIQAIPYRAPEVNLRMKWNFSVDIWNLGVLVSEYFLLVNVIIGSYNFAYGSATFMGTSLR